MALAISNLQVIDGFNIKISEINPATFDKEALDELVQEIMDKNS